VKIDKRTEQNNDTIRDQTIKKQGKEIGKRYSHKTSYYEQKKRG